MCTNVHSWNAVRVAVSSHLHSRRAFCLSWGLSGTEVILAADEHCMNVTTLFRSPAQFQLRCKMAVACLCLCKVKLTQLNHKLRLSATMVYRS